MLSNKCFNILGAVGVVVAITTLAYGVVTANEMDHSQHKTDEHAEHKLIMNQDNYKRHWADYETPDAELIDQYGNTISIDELLNSNDPLMLNFIYTSCTTICPILAATFSQVQKKFGDEFKDVKMISISIDPEYDTSAKLKEYAQKFGAGENWTFLTGNLDTVVDVLNAFDTYRGDKMNHVPITLIRSSADKSWLRLEGFPAAKDLLNEYKSISDKH